MSLGLGLVSPGITIREVDLTTGSTLGAGPYIGAIAAPFAKGSVEEATLVRNENQLIDIFGKPVNIDNQCDYYHVSEAFLSYGGSLKVIRCDDSNLKNSNVGVGSTTSISLKIKNLDDYRENASDSVDWEWASKNPGTWANDLKICVIDDFADQTIRTVSTGSLTVGMAVTCQLSGSRVNIGVGVTSSWNTGTVLEGTLVSKTSTSINVKWNTYTSNGSGVSTFVEYKQGSNFEVKTTDGTIWASSYDLGTASGKTIVDWYDQQRVDVDNVRVYWKSIAKKPVSSSFTKNRGSYNDSFHVVVIDDTGKLTGTVGSILEKFVSVSKSKNAVLSSKSLYYKDLIANESDYIYAGFPRTGVRSKASQDLSDGLWGLDASSGLYYNVIGNKTFILTGGQNYTNGGGYQATLEGLTSAYNKISNTEEQSVDFLLCGPSLNSAIETQAKANYLIDIAETRKDCMVTISPFKGDVVGVTDSEDQTQSIVDFFNGIDSSSYAVFDSGYKQIFDRFTNKFRYIPCNGDIAGLMVRTSTQADSWYSPAGSFRGTLRNAIKLAYNPNQEQRDRLYISRVNPIIYSPGSGTILFGDKTAQTFESAFNRINVRRLFLEMEDTISRIAKSFLFEFNDEFTRTSFTSQVDPYLRDIQSKRGITEYVLVCNGTNNTPDVIDRNEFVAEIYVKPARSINFIGLTFVATRTGVAFEEVIGRF